MPANKSVAFLGVFLGVLKNSKSSKRSNYAAFVSFYDSCRRPSQTLIPLQDQVLSFKSRPCCDTECDTWACPCSKHAHSTRRGHHCRSSIPATSRWQSPLPTYSPGTVDASSPVYIVPPVYVAPAPAFNMQIQSGSNFHRHPDKHIRRERLRSGNAEDSQVGGPGWSGTVWSR